MVCTFKITNWFESGAAAAAPLSNKFSLSITQHATALGSNGMAKPGIMDGYLAEIRLFAGMFIPQKWLACEGQIISIASNPALFSLLGVTYGGDGRTTFNLPDLKGKEPADGLRYIICVDGAYPAK